MSETDTLQYDDREHTYTIGGRRLLSVTEVLKLAGLIDTTWYTEEARDRGSYVAVATALDDRGELDESKVPPEIMGYVTAWRRFRLGTEGALVCVEAIVCNETLRLAGTIDRVFKPSVIMDIKTGASAPWHRLQLAGYRECYGGVGEAWDVYLRPNGQYRVDVRSVSHCIEDRQVFLAALALAHWKRNQGVTNGNRADSRATA